MSLVKWIVQHLAPIFIVTSPVTSYADQIWSVSKSRSSAGFSLDIPLIMLVSSLLKYVSTSHPLFCLTAHPVQTLLLAWRTI